MLMLPLCGRRPGMPELPIGTITFLFTDIEGSTRLWEESPDTMQAALVQHDATLRSLLRAHNGYIFKTLGDAFCTAFDTAADALAAALKAQSVLQNAEWPVPGPFRVRIALHTGNAQERNGDYYGTPLNRVARLLVAAHGGQILVSQATAELVQETLPEGVALQDLGVHRLKDLQHPERIYQLAHADLPREFPPLRSLDRLPNNLPHQLTSFVGREQETEDIRKLVRSTRLVTLTGVGGCGKTRLAVQIAADLLDEFPEGVWIVDFATITDPALVLQATATALELPDELGRPIRESLTDYIQSREMLLLLDNCEHLIQPVAQLAQSLLQAGSRLRILATSREAFGVPGETAWRVPSMSVPDAETPLTLDALSRFEAIRLFVERITATQPDFFLTDQNAPFVRQICQRLDGLPLAIELAAARARVLSVEQLAARLDDRFRLLTGGSRTALPRQQTLRALIDWSYDLLSEAEKTLFRRLSVFSGGWTLAAAEAICSDTDQRRMTNDELPMIPDRRAEAQELEEEILSTSLVVGRSSLVVLTQLVDKSLVLCEESHDGPRYRLLETIRQYCRDRLIETGEPEPLRQRHRDYYLNLAEQAYNSLAAGDRVWMTRIETEYDNLRAALSWSEEVEDSGETGLRMTVALLWFWFGRGHYSEGSEWLERALKHGAKAREDLRARALNGLGAMAHGVGDYARAAELHEQALAIYRKTADRRGISFSLAGLGAQHVCLCQFEQATTILEEALAIVREVGDRWCMGLILLNLAEAAWHLGQQVRAESLCTECLQTGLETGNALWRAYALNGLGAASVYRGDVEAAKRSYIEALRLFCEIGDRRNAAYSIEGFARVAVSEGQYARAARLFGATEALREVIRSPWTPPDRIEYEKHLARLHVALDAETLQQEWRQGRALTLEQTIAFAMERSEL
jgi:predicted ATPase/class 3 adenylate cyclase